MSGHVTLAPWIVWDGDIASHHSYAVVNCEITQALISQGIGVEILGGAGYGRSPGGAPRPLAYVRHRWPPDFSRPDLASFEGVRFVVIQPWEYGYLPLSWIQPLRDQVDEVWAYSEFVRQVYTQSGIDGQRVHVIGCGINPARFRPGLKPANLPTQKGFRFLFVGGAATSRKGL
ncbi:MAG TPA: glycosyltransferase family 4 protein, partial [Firmicutes bacterium]|nr:glycosyltransferase family 4 protein [Bacillota bacterium]